MTDDGPGRAARRKLLALLRSGRVTPAGRGAPDAAPDWAAVSCVVGTRRDLTAANIKRRCATCGTAVFTAVPYPDDVAVICEVCFAERPPEAERGRGR